MEFNILFEAKHIPGKINVVADHLSRDRLQNARLASPGLMLEGKVHPPEWSLPALLSRN